MATPSVPERTLRDTVAAVKTYGSIRAAATALRVAKSTVCDRIAKARDLWPNCLPEASTAPNWANSRPASTSIIQPPQPAFTAPILPPEFEDIDSLVDRLAEEQRRLEAHNEASEWMPFSVEGNKPFALAFIGDPHLDQCDILTLKSHVELIERTPGFWAVGLGDWVNGWTGRLRGNYAFQSLTERDGFALAQWIFKKPIWWLLILGNHDGLRWHGYGSPLRWMETAAPVPVQDWQVKFSVTCGEAEWKVWAAHDFPGTSGWNVLHGPGKRAQLTGAIADLFICGDDHVYGVMETQHEHTGKPYWVGRAKGYKPRDKSYALEKGYGEQTMGHSIAAVFDPRDGSLTCFSNLFKAAAFLEFLQASA